MRDLERLFRPFAVRDVAHQFEDQPLAAAAEDRDARFHRQGAPVLAPVHARGRHRDARHQLLPAVLQAGEVRIHFDVVDREAQQIGAAVAQALASLAIDVDQSAAQIVDKKRLARLLDQVAETLLALTQGHFRFLAFRDIARDRGDADRIAPRVADEEQIPAHLDGGAGLEVAKAEIPFPGAVAHQAGHHRAQEKRPVLPHQVIDDARALDFLQAVEADQALAGFVQVIRLAVKRRETDEIRAFLDELFETRAVEFHCRCCRPGRRAIPPPGWH